MDKCLRFIAKCRSLCMPYCPSFSIIETLHPVKDPTILYEILTNNITDDVYVLSLTRSYILRRKFSAERPISH